MGTTSVGAAPVAHARGDQSDSGALFALVETRIRVGEATPHLGKPIRDILSDLAQDIWDKIMRIGHGRSPV
jgi:hypothetical protein